MCVVHDHYMSSTSWKWFCDLKYYLSETLQAITCISSLPKMFSKRSLKGLSGQLTKHPWGGSRPREGVEDMIWCTVGMKVTKTCHFHGNKKKVQLVFVWKLNYIQKLSSTCWRTFCCSQHNSNRKECLCFLLINWFGVRRMQLKLFERKWLYELWICWFWKWPVYNVSEVLVWILVQGNLQCISPLVILTPEW